MKKAIITGATRGIGKAITELLIKKDYFVFGIYQKSDAIAKELENTYENNFYAIKADISHEKNIKRIFSIFQEKFQALDVLINNAGIDLYGKLETYPLTDWQRMLDVNLTSIFLLSKLAIPFLEKAQNPVIINITSRLGNLDSIEPEFVPYSVTKAGVTVLSKGLALELMEKNIRVNAFVPPPTKTDLFDEVFTKEEENELKNKGCLATPEEEAELIYQLINNISSNGDLVYDSRVKPGL